MMDPKLYKAVVTGNYKYIKTLNSSNWDDIKDMKSHQGNTILHIAVEYKTDGLITKTIISKCKSLLHEQNFNGDSPLHIAVRQKSEIKNVRLLIRDEFVERKKLLRIVNEKGDTALHEAVTSNNLEAVKFLIKADEELACVKNNEGESPLFVAVDKMYYDIARHILKAAPTCSYVGRNGMNVLHAAVIRSKQSTFYTIAHPLCFFLLCVAPLGLVSFMLWKVLAVMLVAYLCLFFLRRIKFSTIGSGFISEVYKRYPCAISEADQFGWIPLHYAAYIGNWRVIKQFLKLDKSKFLLGMKENEGMSAFHIAAKGNQTSVLRQLLKKYPYVKDYVDNKGRTALHVASKEGKIKVVKYFSQKRICDFLVNEGDISGNTPLHLAALQEHSAICKLLIANSRINLRATNNAGLTAIDIIKSKDLINLKRQKKYVASLEDFVPRQAPDEGMSSVIVKAEEHSDACEKPKHPQQAYKELANINLIIVTLVATVTFTAALTVPGGYNTDKNAGTAILAKKVAFRAFVIADSVAFGFSAALLTLRLWKAISSKDEQARTVLKWSLICRNYAVLAMVVAFLSGQYVVLSNSHGLAASAVTVACIAFLAPGLAISWDNPVFVVRFTEIFPVFDVPIRN